MKSQYTALRMPLDLLAEAKQRAAADGRSLANYIKNVVRCDLQCDASSPPQIDETCNNHDAKESKEVELKARITKRMLQRVDDLAIQRGESRSVILREALAEYFRETELINDCFPTAKDELTKRKSISIPDDVLEIGLRNAERRGHKNSFSAYVSWLIERDELGQKP